MHDFHPNQAETTSESTESQAELIKQVSEESDVSSACLEWKTAPTLALCWIRLDTSALFYYSSTLLLLLCHLLFGVLIIYSSAPYLGLLVHFRIRNLFFIYNVKTCLYSKKKKKDFLCELMGLINSYLVAWAEPWWNHISDGLQFNIRPLVIWRI